ncbi:hypothetical protein TRFO_34319 [Tritrichomonas foetus]|uniref:Uncharacterized protein n=1 Tax=Tritrichomonas foetus TaxID=1144522 RepID=A0A1J4JPX8_9EUKA|nr:hypothetical protein TRFO_34319 [Tritrichomonas foetus]|eukprot:OHS99284.1 hypothetical protein TRFO_34319 [Tritrichomonas foetus]
MSEAEGRNDVSMTEEEEINLKREIIDDRSEEQNEPKITDMINDDLYSNEEPENPDENVEHSENPAPEAAGEAEASPEADQEAENPQCEASVNEAAEESQNNADAPAGEPADPQENPQETAESNAEENNEEKIEGNTDDQNEENNNTGDNEVEDSPGNAEQETNNVSDEVVAASEQTLEQTSEQPPEQNEQDEPVAISETNENPENETQQEPTIQINEPPSENNNDDYQAAADDDAQDAPNEISLSQGTQPVVAPPIAPISKERVAPRPTSQRVPQPPAEPRIEEGDEERPLSNCSSYSYTYSYSEIEEEIVRPIRKNQRRKNYIPKYLRNTKREMTEQTIDVPDEEMEILKKRAMNFQTLDDLHDQVYVLLMNNLMEDRNTLAVQEDFKGSERLNKVIEHVSKCQLEQRKYNLQHESYNDMMDQMDEVKAQLQTFDNETNQLETDLRNKVNNQISRITLNHEKELSALQAQWNTESKMRQYNRASPRLVFLRKQFKQLMRQCKFSEAEETKAMIQKLEMAEQEAAIVLLQNNFDDAVAKVEARQREELQFYKTKADIRIKQLRANRNKLREALLNRQRKIEKMGEIISDVDRLWKYNQSQKGKNAVSQRGMKTENTISRLTSRDFTEREDTTLSLPPLQLKRTPRGSVRSSRH